MQRITHPALQRLLLLSTIVLWGLLSLSAQSITAARINEVMIDNVDNYIDNYGKRSPWIEIYNSSAGTINLAGCFLTDDPQYLKKYMIPKGDVLTVIKPRQSIVFFADEMPMRGTFHLNFSLAPDTTHYLALVSNDGSTIIDEVEVPASPPPITPMLVSMTECVRLWPPRRGMSRSTRRLDLTMWSRTRMRRSTAYKRLTLMAL